MKRIQFLVLALLVALMSTAKPVKSPAALRKAQVFVSENMSPVSADKFSLAYRAENKALTDDALFYVYNVGQDNGFVIVAGDDRTAPILGYSDRGTFSFDDMPENLRFWLEYYKEAISEVVANDVHNNAPQARPTDVIEPLLTTRWDQTWPYNLLCPMSGNAQCPTGCVATAMAQVLYYHKYPIEETNIIPAYYCGSLRKTMPALDPTTMDWDLMTDSYDRNSTEESKMAVAKLMQYCGQAVEMGYTATSSGAQTYDLPWRLSRFFNYPETMHYVYHDGYSIAEWDSLLIKELKNNGPVLYTAYTTAWEGHAFVCDGYDGKGLYHINWGWGGSADGYYRISVLDASASGTGGSSTSMRFTINQAALLGLKTTDEDDYVAPEQDLMFPTRPSIDNDRHQIRESVDVPFSDIQIAGEFMPTKQSGYFTMGFALYDDEGQMIEVVASRSDNLWQGYGSDDSFSISGLGKDIVKGHFTIRPVYKKRNGDWMLAKGSERHYVDVLIDETDMYLTPVPKADFVVNSVRMSGQSLAVNLTNNDEEFNGLLMLKKLGDNGKEEVIAYEMVAVEPNSTRTYYIYIDSQYSLDLNSDVFYLTVDFFDGLYFYTNVSNENTDLTCDINILNLSEDKSTIIGEKAFCEAVITNHGPADYRHLFTLALQDENGIDSDGSFKELIAVPAGQTQHIRIDLPILSYDKKQSVVATNFVEKKENVLSKSELLDVALGAIYWNAGGQMKTCIAQDVLTVPEDALAIQLKNAYTNDVVPNSNPNTLYLLDRSIPNSLMGHNVLNADLKTGKISLTDGFDYYIPVEMNATSSISYYRTFTSEDMGKWSTITLPFSPTKILLDGKSIDWFRSPDDSQKSLWIQSVSSIVDGRVNLAFVNKISANEPYLIAIGEELVGKTVEFRGGKTTLAPSALTLSQLLLGDYRLVGTNITTSVSNAYCLNGNLFIYNEGPKEVGAFRAYLSDGVEEGSPAYRELVINGPDIISGISFVVAYPSTGASRVYDMSGRLVGRDDQLKGLSKGIYIIGGKKVVVR